MEVCGLFLYEEAVRGGMGYCPVCRARTDGRAPRRAHASWPQSHISDALFERLSTKSFIQAGASSSLLSPRTRALVLAQWLFNPMKHLRLSPGEEPSATMEDTKEREISGAHRLPGSMWRFSPLSSLSFVLRSSLPRQRGGFLDYAYASEH